MSRPTASPTMVSRSPGLIPASFSRIRTAYFSIAARTVDRLRDTLKAWFEFYNGNDPLFPWWVTEPYQKTAAAMEKYAVLIREKLAGIKPGDRDTIVGDAVGRDMLVSELAYEMIPY